MIFDLNNYLGLHQQALNVRTERTQILASNIANADTPGYQARDINFRTVLTDYLQHRESNMPVAATRQGHMVPAEQRVVGQLEYRIPMQPSLDGNTVEPDVEIAQFAENAIRYQATLRFLSGRISGLRDAITGGR